MQETVVHTYCDIDFIESSTRVEARRITWMVNGKPWNLDVCQQHGLDITIVEIDNFVQQYGHPEGAKPKPPKKQAAAKSQATAAAKTAEPDRKSRAKPPLGPYEISADGRLVCCVQTGRDQCLQDFGTTQGLKKHQTQTHLLTEEAK